MVSASLHEVPARSYIGPGRVPTKDSIYYNFYRTKGQKIPKIFFKNHFRTKRKEAVGQPSLLSPFTTNLPKLIPTIDKILAAGRLTRCLVDCCNFMVPEV